jgi:hypothetical protein
MTTRSIPWPRILAEGFAIVVSILLAFGIQAWWEGVQREQEERTLLRELQATLGEDLQTVTEEADTLHRVNERLGSLIQRLEAGAGMDSVDPEYQQDFWGLHRFLALNVRFGPYETLKTRGLDLISDRDLRVRLTSLYEDSFPYLIENSEIDQRLVRERIVPYMFEHLALDEYGNWVQRQGSTDARSLGLSLARYRRQTLVVFYVPSFTATIASIEDTLAAIEDYLDG